MASYASLREKTRIMLSKPTRTRNSLLGVLIAISTMAAQCPFSSSDSGDPNAGRQESERRLESVNQKDIVELNAIIDNPRTPLMRVAGAITRKVMLEHRNAIAQTGRGTCQGSLARNRVEGAVVLDCTTYILKVIKASFDRRAGSELWQKIEETARANSPRDEQGKLQGFGIHYIEATQTHANWKALFWAPDVVRARDNDGEHPFAYRKARTHGSYYGVKLLPENYWVINFRRTEPTVSEDLINYRKMEKMFFGIIAARGGAHMAILVEGVVYEVHWERSVTDPDVITSTPLRDWKWLSGIIAAPEDAINNAWR